MLDQRRWDIFHSFELRQKKLFLKNLNTKESQRIFAGLYQFTQRINKGYKQLYLKNIQNLVRVHLIFMKVKA
ncbi:MAG: hypothetical protein A3K54_01155 [Omnitrophica WOR_2 bacterium RBG_13_44_8]|nr:MAG: hypothetical protein A3K54_01155 [Omnitrophica WOR_2 bacterium RBG_13_44_8]